MARISASVSVRFASGSFGPTIFSSGTAETDTWYVAGTRPSTRNLPASISPPAVPPLLPDGEKVINPLSIGLPLKFTLPLTEPVEAEKQPPQRAVIITNGASFRQRTKAQWSSDA